MSGGTAEGWRSLGTVRVLTGWGRRILVLMPLPAENGGGSLATVELGRDGKPTCTEHGAMNQLSPYVRGDEDGGDGGAERRAIWRCITTTGTNGRRCDAGTLAVDRTGHVVGFLYAE